MGDGRAFHGALGRAAVRRALLLLMLPLLGGCSTIGSIAGAVTGAISGAEAANPAVGYGVGIGTKAAVDALMAYISRSRHGGEQDALSRIVGPLEVGQSAPWRIKHKVPMMDDEHGQVSVVRDIPNALAPCKEVIFTIESGRPERTRGYYATSICRRGPVWKWAQAEPATERWGVLQ